MKIFLFILYVVLSSSGLILFKLGSGIVDFNLNILGIKLALSFKTIFGIFCYGCSFLLWLYMPYKPFTFPPSQKRKQVGHFFVRDERKP